MASAATSSSVRRSRRQPRKVWTAPIEWGQRGRWTAAQVTVFFHEANHGQWKRYYHAFKSLTGQQLNQLQPHHFSWLCCSAKGAILHQHWNNADFFIQRITEARQLLKDRGTDADDAVATVVVTHSLPGCPADCISGAKPKDMVTLPHVVPCVRNLDNNGDDDAGSEQSGEVFGSALLVNVVMW